MISMYKYDENLKKNMEAFVLFFLTTTRLVAANRPGFCLMT